jgi:methionine-rich copper-binding protein CopC
MAMRSSSVIVAVLAATVLATPARAHPTLKSASPPAEGVATTSPTEIRLSFSEGVIVKFCNVELRDQAGNTVVTGKLAADPKDQKQLVVPLPGVLKAGTYTVEWNVVSVDTHRVKGSYSFKVER